MGHWQNDSIIIDYIADGDVQDDREDDGQWDEGLWAEAGTGTDMVAVMAAVIAPYEALYNGEEEAEEEAPQTPEPLTVTITRDQLECWVGRELSDDEVRALDDAVPHSSIPEAIATIADSLS